MESSSLLVVRSQSNHASNRIRYLQDHLREAQYRSSDGYTDVLTHTGNHPVSLPTYPKPRPIADFRSADVTDLLSAYSWNVDAVLISSSSEQSLCIVHGALTDAGRLTASS